MFIDANEIVPGLWQGANPPMGATLAQLGFKALVLCAEEWQAPAAYYPGLVVVHAPMDDAYAIPLSMAAPAARTVVKFRRRGMRTLVTCNAGVNRSGLVVGLSLAFSGMCGREILRLIQQRRPGALRNEAFAGFLGALGSRREACR